MSNPIAEREIRAALTEYEVLSQIENNLPMFLEMTGLNGNHAQAMAEMLIKADDNLRGILVVHDKMYCEECDRVLPQSLDRCDFIITIYCHYHGVM